MQLQFNRNSSTAIAIQWNSSAMRQKATKSLHFSRSVGVSDSDIALISIKTRNGKVVLLGLFRKHVNFKHQHNQKKVLPTHSHTFCK
jgi:hypothetical protein